MSRQANAETETAETMMPTTLKPSPARAVARWRLRLLTALTAIACVGAVAAVGATSAVADFQITGFDANALNADGTAASQAGSHPFQAESEVLLSMKTEPPPLGLNVPQEAPRNIEVELPPGLVGNPNAAPQCSVVALGNGPCPVATQVGVIGISPIGSLESNKLQWEALYNIVPPPGKPAAFGFRIQGVPALLTASLRPSDYGVTFAADDIPQTLPIYSTKAIIWGTPAASSHNLLRFPSLGAPADESCNPGGAGNIAANEPCPGSFGTGAGITPVPLLRNPTSCTLAGTGLPVRTRVLSWAGNTQERTIFTHEPAPNQETQLGPTGCEKLRFDPSISLQPDLTSPASPSGLTVKLSIPQDWANPGGLEEADLREAKVTLPEGMTVNPASADGLQACTDEQVGIGTDAPASCPLASKIGTVTVKTPLLDETLEGSVFLGTQRSSDPESGQMFRLFIEVRDEARGVVVKLPGQVRANAQTGRLETTFANNPQLPFSDFTLRFKGGARAPLTTPSSCGRKTTTAQLTSWAGQVAELSDSFTVSCVGGGFTPHLEAGTTNPVAGAFSPFTLRLTREDGQQNLAGIDLTLPKGLLAKLAGVPLCGNAEAAVGNCPAASQVGTTTVGVGAGPSPLYVPQSGKAPTAVYLAGPYKGAPYSLLVKVPAQAGPFDLGTVAVRAAITVNPETAQVSTQSDPLPQIIAGVPVSYRDVRVEVNRPDFTLNPTSCEPMQVGSTITSALGTEAHPSSRFQVAGCERLPFKPRLSLKVSGATKRAGYPALRAVLKAKGGSEANIGRVSVALPHSEFLAQEHIKTICTRVQYAAKQCPAGSVYGYAKAWTPLLEKPLEGPVYLRSSNNPLPDLVASLDGQIHIDLAGRIDSVDGGIRNTFEAVPDAPVSKFVLTMQGGKKGLLVNSTDLCASTNRATVKMDGHNGRAHDFRPVVGNSCGGKGRKG